MTHLTLHQQHQQHQRQPLPVWQSLLWAPNTFQLDSVYIISKIFLSVRSTLSTSLSRSSLGLHLVVKHFIVRPTQKIRFLNYRFFKLSFASFFCFRFNLFIFIMDFFFAVFGLISENLFMGFCWNVYVCVCVYLFKV